MDKVLITGAKGQLGNELKVIEKSFAAMECLFHDVDTLDITNKASLEAFMNENKPKFVINCAAYTAVDKAENEIENAEKINTQAVELLTDVCAKHDAFFIHISTDYVFDGKAYRPWTEDMKVNPVSVYGKTKEKGERFVKQYSKGLIIRTAWLYSSFGNNFVKTVLRLAKERGEMNMIYDQVGTPTYAGDLAIAIQAIVNRTHENPDAFVGGIYHFSNEGVCSWFDFAKAIVAMKNIPCKINPIGTKDYPTPAKRPAYSVLDKTKIKTTWCLIIPYWMDSLKLCLEKL